MDGKVPDKTPTPTLSNGCTTATFSWTAPFNGGLTITQYGWQYSTDSGSTWSTESIVYTTSASIDVNNNTNSYIIRVRAFNVLGWGEYSDNSPSTTAWTYESYADPTSCTDSSACDNCGSRTGSKSRTCYRYVRSGCTTTSGLNCGDYGNCGSYGACSGTRTYYNTSGTYPPSNGISYTEFTETFTGATYLRRTNDGNGGCGCDSYYAWQVSYCNVTNTWTHTPIGCVQFTLGCGGK